MKQTVVLLFALFASLTASTLGEAWSKERKIEGLKWHCSTLCSAHGGVSDFVRKTLTCKCYLEKGTIDNVMEDILHKNAAIVGMNLKIIKKIKGPKRVARQAINPPKVLESVVEAKNKSETAHSKDDQQPKRIVPQAPLSTILQKGSKKSTIIPNRVRTSSVAPSSSTSPTTIVDTNQKVTNIATEASSATEKQEMPLELTTMASDVKITTAAESILGQSRYLFPRLSQLPVLSAKNTKLTVIPSFLPRMAGPHQATDFAKTKFQIANSQKIALEAAARQLNALLSKLKQNAVDHLTFMAEIQAVKTTLRTLDGFDSKTRSRNAERAFEELKEREKERLVRFRVLANRSKLNFARNPIVGSIHIDSDKSTSVVPLASG